MDFITNTGFYKAIAGNWILQFLISGGGILGAARIMLWLHGLRIISFFRCWYNRRKFLDHEVFKTIEDAVNSRFVENGIRDIARKGLAREMLGGDFLIIKQILSNNLNFIFKKQYFWDYFWSFPDFTNEKIVNLFISEYNKSRETLYTKVKMKATLRNRISDEDFERFYHVYSEFFSIYEIYLFEHLHALKPDRNIYGTLFNIMREFKVHIETIYKTGARSFNNMNGRLYGIQYRNHVIGLDDKIG